VRRGLLAATLVAAFCASATTAQAATVSQYAYGFGISFTASPGERNTVTWTVGYPTDVVCLAACSGPPPVVIADATAPVTAGNGCSQLGPHAAVCELDDRGYIDLGDGDDSFVPTLANNNQAGPREAWQFSIHGGPGSDRLVGAPGVNNGLAGEDGNDVIVQAGGGSVAGGAGNDKIYLAGGYRVDYLYGSNLSCGLGVDTLIAPKNEPPPADCEKKILLPRVLGSV
jgi:Ca2+-binding RTX toxin-like protein